MDNNRSVGRLISEIAQLACLWMLTVSRIFVQLHGGGLTLNDDPCRAACNANRSKEIAWSLLVDSFCAFGRSRFRIISSRPAGSHWTLNAPVTLILCGTHIGISALPARLSVCLSVCLSTRVFTRPRPRSLYIHLYSPYGSKDYKLKNLTKKRKKNKALTNFVCRDKIIMMMTL